MYLQRGKWPIFSDDIELRPFLSRLVLDHSIVKDSDEYLLKTENTKLAHNH
jgi:hypothetical protein